MFNLDHFRTILATESIGRIIQYYPQLDSTNTKAWYLVVQNYGSGTVIITDDQIAGRGRRANRWISIPHQSLTFSIILYPDSTPEIANLYSLIAGLAISDTLLEYNITAGLKWPNDILVNGKKVGGILCESKISGREIRSLVIGIGLNVSNGRSDFPAEIRSQATSLFIESGKKYQLEKLLASILKNIEDRLNSIKNIELIVRDWENRCVHLKRQVSVHLEDQTITGEFKGLTRFGQALVAINGQENIFNSGEIV